RSGAGASADARTIALAAIKDLKDVRGLEGIQVAALALLVELDAREIEVRRRGGEGDAPQRVGRDVLRRAGAGEFRHHRNDFALRRLAFVADLQSDGCAANGAGAVVDPN